MLAEVSLLLYRLQQIADSIVSSQLQQVSPVSLAIIYFTGLITSLTPCMLSMLPLTIAYIGGYERGGRLSAFFQSIFFAAGLATTLSALGIFAALFGKVYGQVGKGLPLIVSVIAMVMGLNLLEVIPLPIPQWNIPLPSNKSFPKSLQSYLLGVSFGFIASPCSTPVLITLLAYVSSSGNLILSSLFLGSYALGYVSPLVVAGTFTGIIKSLISLKTVTRWLNPLSGIILVVFGVYSLISRL
ncbi:MAG: cytochrome c biogenesis protein CcdA [Geminocystis sp.]|nr:cytochrome c biogenesis protein CcdA [Geminocystis sp.]